MVYILMLSLLLIVLLIWTRYRSFARLIDQIPGPRPLPIIGNLLLFNIPPKKIWIMTHKLQKEYPIFRIWSGNVAMVFTRDPDHAKVLLLNKKIMNKEVANYKNVKCFGNDGLIVSVGKLWESRRKMFNQAFTPNMLEFYSKKIDACSKKLIIELATHEKSTVHEVWQLMENFAFAVGCGAIMDYDLVGERKQKGQIFQDACTYVCDVCYYRIFHPYIKDWMMKFLPIGRRAQQAWRNGENFAREVIEERQKYHKSSNLLKNYLNNIDTLNDDEIRVMDVMLLHEQANLIGTKDLQDEAVLMMSAAFLTTATALTFLILSLAENEEVQTLTRQELLDVMGGYNKVITMKHIKQLDYLERCVKESLRLYTTVPFYGRSIEEEVKLGDYTIPVGTEVYLNAFQLHRDPELWPDPLKFNPDRFLPENLENQHPFAYVPFAKGLRNCIGQKFAMIEMKTIIAHILYNYYLKPIDLSADFELHAGITLVQDKTRVEFIKIH